jgi:hypothetical protein
MRCEIAVAFLTISSSIWFMFSFRSLCQISPTAFSESGTEEDLDNACFIDDRSGGEPFSKSCIYGACTSYMAFIASCMVLAPRAYGLVFLLFGLVSFQKKVAFYGLTTIFLPWRAVGSVMGTWSAALCVLRKLSILSLLVFTLVGAVKGLDASQWVGCDDKSPDSPCSGCHMLPECRAYDTGYSMFLASLRFFMSSVIIMFSLEVLLYLCCGGCRYEGGPRVGWKAGATVDLDRDDVQCLRVTLPLTEGCFACDE